MIRHNSQSDGSRWSPTCSFHTVANPRVQDSSVSIYHLPASADFFRCTYSVGANFCRIILRYLLCCSVARIYDLTFYAASALPCPRSLLWTFEFLILSLSWINYLVRLNIPALYVVTQANWLCCVCFVNGIPGNFWKYIDTQAIYQKKYLNTFWFVCQYIIIHEGVFHTVYVPLVSTNARRF